MILSNHAIHIAEHFKILAALAISILILSVLLYGCPTWSLTLVEENTLQSLEHRVCTALVGPKKREMGESLSQLYVNYDELIYNTVNVTFCFPKPCFYIQLALGNCETNINLCIGCQTSNRWEMSRI
jgi:hypothetical protein